MLFDLSGNYKNIIFEILYKPCFEPDKKARNFKMANVQLVAHNQKPWEVNNRKWILAVKTKTVAMLAIMWQHRDA